MNNTITGLNSSGVVLNTVSPYAIVPILMLIMLITFFILFKNVRKFIYGGVILFPISIIFWVSESISKDMVQGNMDNFFLLLRLIGVIIGSIITGTLFLKTKTGKIVEELLEDKKYK